jgi:hypothetical protein
VEIEQTIDDKIMAWHLEGRDMQRAALEAKKERRVELMAKSDQLRPISSRGVRRHTKGTENDGDGSFISDTSNPRQMRHSGRSGAVAKPKRLLKTSTQLLEEVRYLVAIMSELSIMSMFCVSKPSLNKRNLPKVTSHLGRGHRRYFS